MTNSPLSRRDLEFLLFDWLDVEALTRRDRFAEHSRDTFDAVLDLSADIAAKHFAPHNKKADSEEPTVGPDGKVNTLPETEKALRIFAEAGLFAGSFDADLGGLQLPSSIMRAAMAWFQASNAGTAGYPFLTVANANLLVAHGSADQVDSFVRPMLEGRFFGTMCLSEPQAGSSLADITTRAVEQEDGSYRLTGTKMWISGGDHELSENIVHLVLAKVPGGGSGVKGISLFVVPKYLLDDNGDPDVRNDVALVGLNHKMGNRGTTNALLNFGDGSFNPGGSSGAVGYLVGEPNRGLTYMFHMMNEARIGVGFLATALGYAGYRQSISYAQTRTQGRDPVDRDPAAKPVPIIDHADVKRMLLAQKSYVEGALALGLYCAKLVDEQDTADDASERDQKTLLLDVLTPIAKSWPSQWCLRANDLAIQVHGGYGYTRDYDVEQFYRDNRLNQIHEGTHGVQGLDLLGRKMSMRDGAGLHLLLDTMRVTISHAREIGGEANELAEELGVAVDRIAQVTSALVGAADRREALANSSIYLEAVGHVVVAWIWLEQFLATGHGDEPFHHGKRQAARYFYRYELPSTEAQFALLARMDRTTLDMDANWF